MEHLKFNDLPPGEQKLLTEAKAAREKSYSPYSNFPVGSALITTGGRIFTGTNVENSSYGLSLCAELGAIQSAVTAGHKHFNAIAVIGGLGGQSVIPTPCGRCRQVMMEFSPPHSPLKVLLSNESGTDIIRTDIQQLLPLPFGPVNLNNE